MPLKRYYERKVSTMNKPVTQDIFIEIHVNPATGKTILRSGNGQPLNPLNVISICLSVALGNVQNMIREASLVIDPNAKRIVSPEGETPSDKPHEVETPCQHPGIYRGETCPECKAMVS